MANIDAYEVHAEEGFPVTLPSGATFRVKTSHEEEYLRESITRYHDDNHFVNISDIRDIDKLVTFELLIHRWTNWISAGQDYSGDDINTKQFAEMTNAYSTEVRQLKKALGVDKSNRDRTRGDDSVAALWDNLRRRAAEFGVMRNEQFEHVITSFQRIKSLIQFHDACDDLERKENACDLDDIFEVVREEIVKFDRIDERFRHEKQKMWVRAQ